jgi:hypothetical protein
MQTRRSILRGAVLIGGGAAAGVWRALPAAAAVTPIPCGTWGARPPSAPPTILATRPDKILVHHTETANRAATGPAAAYQVCRAVQNHHMDVQGWSDSGQHFTISREGYVLEGRHRSAETLQGGRAMVQAAHCPGQNDRAIGIENEGSYVASAPPAAVWDALVAFCTQVCTSYGITASSIHSHRDFHATTCPGDAFYARIPALRTAVAVRIAAARLRAWPTVSTGSAGIAVTAAQHLLRANGSVVAAVDGSFGSGTKAAVTGFQTRRGLTGGGVLGATTWEALVVQLRRGASGDAVRALQSLLAAAGRPVTVDGSFAAGTEQAVRGFQSARQLPADGIVGADTWFALVTG